jgi:hypothetical protein
LPRFKVADNILFDILDALVGTAHQGFHLIPLGLGLLGFIR